MITKEEFRDRLLGWRKTVLQDLRDTLLPFPQSKERVEWRCSLEDSNIQLAQHLSAFANTPGGGFLVFGVHPNGTVQGIQNSDYKNLIRRIDSVARKSLRPPVQADHSILQFENKDILAYIVHEADQKPVHRRGGDLFESYTRPIGETRRMSRVELASAILQSSKDSLEALPDKYSNKSFAETLHTDMMSSSDDGAETSQILIDGVGNDEQLSRGVLARTQNGELVASSLGLLLYGNNLQDIVQLKGKRLAVTIYGGIGNSQIEVSKTFNHGYVVSLRQAIPLIFDHFVRCFQNSTGETRRSIRRAITELLTNALIHQNFGVPDNGPLAAVFSDRIEFTSPGNSEVNPLRLFERDRSCRNEKLRWAFAGNSTVEGVISGLRKVVEIAERYRLPPPLFRNTDTGFLATFYAPRPRLSKEEKVRACYQHACLLHLQGNPMTNESLRLRLGVTKSNYSIISRVIADATEGGFIRALNQSSKSKRFSSYVPFWA